MRIELTPDLESALVSAARRQGTTPTLLAEAYLRERLDVQPQESPATQPKNLAEFLEGYIGVLAIEDDAEGRNNLSEDTGRRFTEVLAQRRAEGRL
jgi:hypothetical protein